MFTLKSMMDTPEALDDKEWSVGAGTLTESLRALTTSLDEEGDELNTDQYINKLFPTEQSLSNIDTVIAKMEYKMSNIDDEIQWLVRSEAVSRQEGHRALERVRILIAQLSTQISDINAKAERSEEAVREITAEIKQLDCAKTNLTAAITTLNHLHMLAGGIDSLRAMQRSHRYKETVLPLQAIMEVMKHFEDYTDIRLINSLRDEVLRIRHDLAAQIIQDFKDAHSGNKRQVSMRTLAEACLVVDTLEPKTRRELLDWFIALQLQEYGQLFAANEEAAWLDKVERRYAWLKRRLIQLQQTHADVFPPHWSLPERLVKQFCKVTRESLSEIMLSRKQEIDVKLLLYAIQKTYDFEKLLEKRFSVDAPGADSDMSEEKAIEEGTADGPEGGRFMGLIGGCFEPYLYLYIESLDSNLASLLDRFVQEAATQASEDSGAEQGAVLTSCADLFMFYKKCLVQCTQLTTGKPMLELAGVFGKYLRAYAVQVLQASLPKQAGPQVTAAGLIHNLQALLKEGETLRLNKQELSRITSVITTSEYCLETTLHLENKLKEKVSPGLAERVDLSPEVDMFHHTISSCIQLLVQDLELACEPALAAMAKISWFNMASVGDQSAYVSQIILHLKTTVPVIRDKLSSSRKYFTQFCIRFANSFIPKFIQSIYKCKPISTVGSEQLLLDTHMLKTVLLDLPSIGSEVKRPAPATYTKVVIKLTTKAEMILKLVMAPLDTGGAADGYVAQFVKLLPDAGLPEFHKVLDMKGVKKTQLAALDVLFREKTRSAPQDTK